MQLKATCCTATEPRPVEDLMQACDLHTQEEVMVLDLLKGLTEVRFSFGGMYTRGCNGRLSSAFLPLRGCLLDCSTKLAVIFRTSFFLLAGTGGELFVYVRDVVTSIYV